MTVIGFWSANFKKIQLSVPLFGNLLQKVTVTESYIPEFSLSTFFASLGGSLGLWLGVGVVQLLSGGVNMASWIRSKTY